MKNSFRILIITTLSVVLISCRTVKAQCGFSLMRDTVTKMDVYQVVDEFPSYPGGGSALLQYVGKHYRVPENDVQSTFNLTFVVDKTGKLKGVRIHKKNRKEYSSIPGSNNMRCFTHFLFKAIPFFNDIVNKL